MTSFDKNLLLLLVTILSLVAVASGLSGARPIFELNLSSVAIVVGVEFLVYFIASMAMNQRATVGMALGSAVAFVILRCICSLIGGAAFGIFAEAADGFNPALAWLNPVAAAIQVFTVLVTGPYILAITFPDLIGKDAARSLRGGPAAPSVSSSRSSVAMLGSLETSPTGGFIQVFSYEELTGVIRKSPGLEGFVIYNEEGLVVWKDIPMKIDVDALAARIMSGGTQLGRVVLDSGLSRLRRIAIESRDHHILSTTLNQSFGMIIIFSSRTQQDEMFTRISILSKTAREFLQWKYPSLPLSTGMSRDRIALDMV